MKRTDTALTQRTIDAALRSGDRTARQRVRCRDVAGFSVVVYRHSFSYWFEYKPRGTDPDTGRQFNTRHIRVGDGQTHSLAEARAAAADLRRRVVAGRNPKAEAERAVIEARAARQRAIAEAASQLTCQDKLAAYEAVLATRGHTARRQKEQVGQVRLALISMDALWLTPHDVTKSMVEKMLILCPAASRDTRFGALDRFLRWALKESGRISPILLFDRHEKPKPPPSRRRVLTGPELSAIWRAAERLPNAVTADLVQFVIAIPCRRGEAAVARWRDIDVSGRVWHQPTSKNQDPHDFPLNDRALAILARRRQATAGHPDDFVFPGPRAAKSFMGWSKLIKAISARIDKETPVAAGWRLHDVRRSFVTHLADAGRDETVLDLIINHRASRSRGGIRGVYQRAQRWPERVTALAAWDALLGSHLGPVKGKSIVRVQTASTPQATRLPSHKRSEQSLTRRRDCSKSLIPRHWRKKTFEGETLTINWPPQGRKKAPEKPPGKAPQGQDRSG
jgi:integrase